MQILRAVFYGIISGFAEFLPISSRAHQTLYAYMTGFQETAFLKMMVYLACLLGVIVCYWSKLGHIRREIRLASLPKKRRKRVPDMKAVLDFRLIMLSAIPVLIGLFAQQWARNFFGRLTWITLTAIITGTILYFLQFLPVGVADSKAFSPMDGVLLGLFCVLSFIPGLSYMAMIIYFARSKRCTREYVLDLSILASIPLLLGLTVTEGIILLSNGVSTLSGMDMLAASIAAVAAFAGAVSGISLMRYFAVKLDFYGFSYYCWGLAVFSFIYYLMT